MMAHVSGPACATHAGFLHPLVGTIRVADSMALGRLVRFCGDIDLTSQHEREWRRLGPRGERCVRDRE